MYQHRLFLVIVIESLALAQSAKDAKLTGSLTEGVEQLSSHRYELDTRYTRSRNVKQAFAEVRPPQK